MSETKLVLAHCALKNRKYCLELQKSASRWELVNLLEISEEEAEKIPFDVPPTAEMYSSSALVPCAVCGTRKIASCTCSKGKTRCNSSDKYNFQCAYCSELRLDRPIGAEPVIYVSSEKFDDIGEVLTSMNVKYSPYMGKLDCDLLFVNCGTDDTISPAELRQFVAEGGCVYLSDWGDQLLSLAFPGVLTFGREGASCKISADVTDAELRQIAGGSVEVEFDLSSWAIIKDIPGLNQNEGKVLLRASSGNQYRGRPIMVSFRQGKGTVFYTSFHNHKQASEKEKMLLQLLLLKQLGTKANRNVEDMGALIGLNIASMKEKFKR